MAPFLFCEISLYFYTFHPSFVFQLTEFFGDKVTEPDLFSLYTDNKYQNREALGDTCMRMIRRKDNERSDRDRLFIDGKNPCRNSMIKRSIAFIFTVTLGLSALAGCAFSSNDASGTENTENSYEQITPVAAKALMDSEENYVILDVRTEEEFSEAHIDGAVLIPDYEIGENAGSMLTDKDQLILVYCRSGRRSKNAAAELASLGYTNVKEFGGIMDWPYETVTD